ncbi:MAG: tetratricopeptide repeat protein [Bacteroidales bacterium]|jgi:tetratricopeptide (TPR) repeat protein|nr:tetratricopeptide repeat protein [Bacteroidales bacterium]
MAPIQTIRILAIMLVILTTNIMQAQINQQVDTTDWQQLVTTAKHYREQNNTYRAFNYAQKAMILNPCDVACRELAYCYFARGGYNECINLCRQLLTPTEINPAPDSSEVYLMARCFEKLEIADSLMKYQYLETARNIENQANTVAYARSLIAIKAYKPAVNLLERYCQIDSTNIAVNSVLANAYYNAGKPTNAIDIYEKCVAAGDTRVSTLYYLAMAHIQKDHTRRALECLELADEISKGTNALTIAMLGLLRLETDSTAAQGERDINFAIDMMKPNAELLYRLYYGLGDYYITHNFNTAIKYFKQAIEVNPDAPITYYQIGYCYYMTGNEDLEYKYWNKFIDLCGDKEITDNKYVHYRVIERLKRIKEKRFMEGKDIPKK